LAEHDVVMVEVGPQDLRESVHISRHVAAGAPLEGFGILVVLAVARRLVGLPHRDDERLELLLDRASTSVLVLRLRDDRRGRRVYGLNIPIEDADVLVRGEGRSQGELVMPRSDLGILGHRSPRPVDDSPWCRMRSRRSSTGTWYILATFLTQRFTTRFWAFARSFRPESRSPLNSTTAARLYPSQTPCAYLCRQAAQAPCPSSLP